MPNKCIDCKNEGSLDKIRYDFIEDVEDVERCKPTNRRRLLLKVSFATFQIILGLFLVIFVVFPLIYKFSYPLQRAAVFLNFKNIPPNPDYKHPEKYGIYGARNFYVTTDTNIVLGVWQIVPEEDQANFDNKTDEDFEEILKDGRNVVLYNHGNGGCRLTSHRVELYKVLRRQFHVITYDYRSFGDSSDENPSEEAVVQDVMFMIKWVKKKAKGSVFVWGHSLGTSLATHALANLQPEGIKVTGLILESPFNNLREEISEFPLSMMFRNLPWFSYTIIEPMQDNKFLFKTDVHICHVDVPVMIMHAVDDGVVPYKLGLKLYQAALKCKKDFQNSVQFHKFEAQLHYGHKFLYKDSRLPDLINNFVVEAVMETKTKIKFNN